MADYTIVRADDVANAYAETEVPGELHALSDALHSEQLALTLVRVPPHCDFGQGSGHRHADIEELYLVTRGTLTMRLDDDIRTVHSGSVVRVSPSTVRSHRNEHDEPVEMWAISPRTSDPKATKVDHFWEASPAAVQRRRSEADDRKVDEASMESFPASDPPAF